jgi:EAL domain-containing protein (putative c-di-GMP-specific phosphodiesterase class I)
MMQIANLNFLVVEDHAFQRKALVGLLQRLNAKSVHAAANGVEALRILTQPETHVDVIISDLEMPNMDGMEFIRHLGTRGYRACLIIVSALDRALLASVETMTLSYGINLLGAMPKPVTADAITALLSRQEKAAAPARNLAGTPRQTYTVGEIVAGLENNEFEPFFQPRVEVATRRLVGAEALARWRHPQHGVVPPSAFIETLEEHDEIDRLMWVMLNKSIAFVSTLPASCSDSIISVNLSLKSLTDVDLATRIVEIAKAYNVKPGCICLEVTESAATTDVGKALENLTRLRMKGFGLSIDDYGTGYSSMQQLMRVPFTELKIDRSFVTNATVNQQTRVILGSSLEMARKLGIAAVAEGVETQQDWDLLVELGCDSAQGYFIAKPMPQAAYLAWERDIPNDAMTIATH